MHLSSGSEADFQSGRVQSWSSPGPTSGPRLDSPHSSAPRAFQSASPRLSHSGQCRVTSATRPLSETPVNIDASFSFVPQGENAEVATEIIGQCRKRIRQRMYKNVVREITVKQNKQQSVQNKLKKKTYIIFVVISCP